METYEREMDSIEWCMCSAADDRTFSVYRCIERRSQHKLQCHVSTYSVGGPVRLLGKVGKLVCFCRARALLSVAPGQVSMRVYGGRALWLLPYTLCTSTTGCRDGVSVRANDRGIGRCLRYVCYSWRSSCTVQMIA